MGRPWCCGRGCGVSRRERREERRAALAAAAARTAATRSLPDDTWQVEGCLSENLRYSCQLYEYSSTLGAVRVTLTLTLALALALTFWKQPCRSQARQRPATPPLPLTCESGRSE